MVRGRPQLLQSSSVGPDDVDPTGGGRQGDRTSCEHDLVPGRGPRTALDIDVVGAVSQPYAAATVRVDHPELVAGIAELALEEDLRAVRRPSRVLGRAAPGQLPLPAAVGVHYPDLGNRVRVGI